LDSNNYVNSLEPGNIIPIRVQNVKYTIGSHKIAINAVPYSYIPPMKYLMSSLSNLSPDASRELKMAKDRHMEEIKLFLDLEKSNPSGVKFFQTMLYPFKEEKPIDVSTINIADILKNGSVSSSVVQTPIKDKNTEKHTIMYNDVRIKTPSTFAIETVPNEKIHNKETNIMMTPVAVLIRLIEDNTAIFKNIREMVEIYSGDVLKEHKKLWVILNQMKT